MLPEYILAAMITLAVGWSGFNWRRAEHAAMLAQHAVNLTDKLELKLAEKYLTKQEFESQMARLFKVLGRFEEKLDYQLSCQTPPFKRKGSNYSDDTEV